MKKLVILVVVVSILIIVAPMTAMAQTVTGGEFALAIRLDSSSSEIGGIYHLNDKFLINPSFSYTYQFQDVSPMDAKREIIEYNIEMGFFYNVNASEQMSLFLGPKIGYQYQIQKITRDLVALQLALDQEKLHGLSITGVFGVQYMFSDKIGITGSVELQGIKLTGNQTDGEENFDMALNQIRTGQKLCVVFYF